MGLKGVEVRANVDGNVLISRTNDKGIYEFNLRPQSSLNIAVNHGDYHSYKNSLALNEQGIIPNIVLKPFEKVVPIERSEKEEIAYIGTIEESKSKFVSEKSESSDESKSLMANPSLISAKFTSKGNENLVKQYSIQIGAFKNPPTNFKKYEGIADLGEVYSITENNTAKIRIGRFADRESAEILSKELTKRGQKHFISVDEVSAKENLPKIAVEQNPKTDFLAKGIGTPSKYVVRLASYKDPKWFDSQKLEGIGEITKEVENGWTIFYLSGFNSESEAIAARSKVRQKGFNSAYVMLK